MTDAAAKVAASGGGRATACFRRPKADDRAAIWDESATKRTLLENFAPVAEFPMKGIWPISGVSEDAEGTLLRRTLGTMRFEAVATNAVDIALGQPWSVPPSSNYEFLWLEARRTWRGRLLAAAVQSPELLADFEYSDGFSAEHRAVLPILETGVLINYRVDSLRETQRWLHGRAAENAGVRSIRFRARWPGTFQPSFRGRIVTCRLVPKAMSR